MEADYKDIKDNKGYVIKADGVLGLIEKVCLYKKVLYIRIDTDFPNKRMQHILKKMVL